MVAEHDFEFNTITGPQTVSQALSREIRVAQSIATKNKYRDGEAVHNRAKQLRRQGLHGDQRVAAKNWMNRGEKARESGLI